MVKTVEISGDDAVSQVHKCIAEPGVHFKDPITLPSAQRVWNFHAESQHQCYWNDRFVVAVMCGMDEHHQRIAAWAAVSNGFISYWEWETHYGFNTAAALKYLGIVPEDFDPDHIRRPGSFPDYNMLDREIAIAIIEKFNLPTTRFDGRTLTVEQLQDRKELQSHYPMHNQL